MKLIHLNLPSSTHLRWIGVVWDCQLSVECLLVRKIGDVPRYHITFYFVISHHLPWYHVFFKYGMCTTQLSCTGLKSISQANDLCSFIPLCCHRPTEVTGYPDGWWSHVVSEQQYKAHEFGWIWSEMARWPCSKLAHLLTPWEMNMEPKNYPIEKENHVPNLHFWCSMFCGV